MGNLCIAICSFSISLLLLILFFSKKRINNVDTKIFTVLVLTSFLNTVMVIVFTLFANIGVNEVILNIISKIDYLLYLVWTWGIFIYILNVVFKISEKNIFKIVKLTTILNILVFIFICFQDVFISNENNLVYSYGSAFNFLYIFCAIYFILIVWFLIVRFKYINHKKIIPIYVLAILFGFTFVIKNINPGLLVIPIILSYVNLILYFTIENPDLRINKKLKLAMLEAEKASRAKSDFLASMSHEIRTPLNSIVGFSDNMLVSETLDEARENALDVVSASSDLLEIVNSILDVSKIESGKLEIIDANYESKKMFDEVEKLIKGRLNDKKIDFRVNIDSSVPEFLYGDENNVKKILINLLSNALKYTFEGFFNLDVKCIKKINVCKLVIVVKDTGRGIKKQDFEKIFNKFNKLEIDSNASLAGAGLGLSITKSLVELMGGTIKVESSYGEGTTFVVNIKQRLGEDNSRDVVVNLDDNLDLTGKKILAVDDNKLNLKLVTKLLTRYNAVVDSVESAKEAFKILESNNYDLILMDDMMPKMSGTEALRILLKEPKFNTPIVVLTANAIAGVRQKYLNEGFDDYLSKPIVKAELFRVLSTYVNSDTLLNGAKDYSDKSILIVDDNEINLKISKRFLAKYKINVETVMSGNDCIEKLKENKYDLVFMDDMMPTLSGVEALRKIQMLNLNVPMVVITANCEPGCRENYLSIGFDEYIAKPINKRILDDVLNRFLSIKSKNIVKEDKTIFNRDIDDDFDSDYLIKNGIDPTKGIKLFGGEKEYKKYLIDFYDDFPARLKELNKFNNDLDTYLNVAIELKNMCEKIGIKKLSDLFILHEIRAKENDIDYIKSEFDNLISESKKYYKIIGKFLGK